MKFARYALLCSLPVLLPATQGCQSAMVDATIRNQTTSEVRLIEVQYPTASFGVQVLAPGGEFHYRFKILGTGDLSLTYTDQQRQEHTSRGPELREGQQGRLGITINAPIVNAPAVTWNPLPTVASR